jgi:hypothetical protein
LSQILFQFLFLLHFPKFSLECFKQNFLYKSLFIKFCCKYFFLQFSFS